METEMRKNTVIKKRKGDGTLIVLCDMGYDIGMYSHIKVLYGLVDARTVKSAIISENNGYQSVLKLDDMMLGSKGYSRKMSCANSTKNNY